MSAPSDARSCAATRWRSTWSPELTVRSAFSPPPPPNLAHSHPLANHNWKKRRKKQNKGTVTHSKLHTTRARVSLLKSGEQHCIKSGEQHCIKSGEQHYIKSGEQHYIKAIDNNTHSCPHASYAWVNLWFLQEQVQTTFHGRCLCREWLLKLGITGNKKC